jgi:hypothetical protein
MKQTVRLEKLLASLPALDHTLNTTVVYQDARTLRWARQAAEHVEKVAGKARIRSTWWRVDDLFQPGVMAGAVSRAMRADLIIVALEDAEGLPMPFYVWTNSWLPHHRPGPSALIALSEPRTNGNGTTGRVHTYLREVARQGRMDFVDWIPIQSAAQTAVRAVDLMPCLDPVPALV